MRTAGSPLLRANLRVVPGGGAEAATDEAVLLALERGERSFGTLLYDRVNAVVEATLQRMLGRGEPEFEDLVQSSFEQIVVTLGRGRFAGACNLRSWAAAVTCNVALNALRSRRTRRRYFDTTDPAVVEPTAVSHLHPERAASVRDDLQRVRAALAAMSPKLSQTLVLHDALGHDLAEIAVLTGVSVAAAQARLTRGRRELRLRVPPDDHPRRGEP